MYNFRLRGGTVLPMKCANDAAAIKQAEELGTMIVRVERDGKPVWVNPVDPGRH